jgi:hypothetical protein
VAPALLLLLRLREQTKKRALEHREKLVQKSEMPNAKEKKNEFVFFPLFAA